MSFTPLIEVTHGGSVENIHFGAVAVVDAGGLLKAACGDLNVQVFGRSALKPFQALPLIHSGAYPFQAM